MFDRVVRVLHLHSGRSADTPTRFTGDRQCTVAEGQSTKEVAVTLDLGVKTADTHRANLMRKLGLHCVGELVLYAVRNNIILATPLLTSTESSTVYPLDDTTSQAST
ncbi:MAG TPA: LuxR C-terminal-related transcriptional regulator [Terriglobales bacterium]|nr:LuxR C-terminal-related transcriptional regulator [Terriglobales bacterium]